MAAARNARRGLVDGARGACGQASDPGRWGAGTASGAEAPGSLRAGAGGNLSHVELGDALGATGAAGVAGAGGVAAEGGVGTVSQVSSPGCAAGAAGFASHVGTGAAAGGGATGGKVSAARGGGS